MNAYHDLPAKLRGFRPRQPSPSIRRSLFGRIPQAPPSGAARLQPWFAPLTAAALVVLTVATVWPGGGGSAQGPLSLAAAHTWEPGTDPIERNAPPASRIRSTNAGPVASSFGSLLLRQTNVLAR